ncbi:MAG: hypothetical protein PHX43_02215 [Alphaproteobacteria bacterium]|nr:hypothetical protein [Alphaproteobacteria bacterium]
MPTINKRTGVVSEFDGKSAVEIKDIALARIKRLKDSAFLHNGWFVVYSGPSRECMSGWEKTHLTPPQLNEDRAKRIAKDWGAATVWLDGSPIGQWLDDNNLYACLEEKNGERNDAYRADVDIVMAAISKTYIKKAFGQVATAVCGADHSRMFYSVELREIVRNKRVETINELPRELVKKFYDMNSDEAFQLICWAELGMSKQRADENPADIKVQYDYDQRLFYYAEEREHTRKNSAVLSVQQERKSREKRLELFASCMEEITSNKTFYPLYDFGTMSICDPAALKRAPNKIFVPSGAAVS